CVVLAGSIVAVANVYGAVTNTPAIPSFDVRFANTNLIRLYDDDTADPYPSSIFVSGMTSLVNGVTVTLEGLTHSFPSDIEVLLVGPTGEAVLLMSDAGGGASISNVRLKFDQAASDSLPFNQTIVSGSYQPSDYEEQLPDFFPPPAPAQLYQESLSIFDGTNPNGLWQLYIVDSVDEDSG